MHLGKIINNFRTKNKMSMDAFSDISGLSKSYISMLEKDFNPTTGKSIAPTIDVIRKVSNAMNLDFDILFSMLEDSSVSLKESTDYTVNLSEIQFALFGEIKDLTEEEQEELLEYVKWNRQRKANKK